LHCTLEMRSVIGDDGAAAACVCVHCRSAVPRLYIEYSKRNIRLLECNSCHRIADPFVEMGILELFVALVLHRPMAYIHAIHNRGSLKGALGKELVHAVLRLPLLALLAEGYIVWSCAVNVQRDNTSLRGQSARWWVGAIFSVQSDSDNVGSSLLLTTVIDVAILQMVFRTSVFVLTMCAAWLTKEAATAQKVAIGVVLSELSVVVIALMVICGYPHHLYLAVVLFCQLASLVKGIHHAAGLSLGVSAAVALLAWFIRQSVGTVLVGANEPPKTSANG